MHATIHVHIVRSMQTQHSHRVSGHFDPAEPAHMLQVIDEWSGKGFRLLALASGGIGGLPRQSLGLLALEQLEAQADSFDLLGLLVLSNQLREDSIHTVDVLQHQ